MRQANRLLAGIVGLVSALGAAAAWGVEGDGLTPSPDGQTWSRWQGRVLLGNTVLPWQAALGRAEAAGLKVDRLGLIGDYYFSRALVGHGSSGGFRTTGGLFHAPRAQLTPLNAGRLLIGGGAVDRQPASGTEASALDADSATLPYLGVGYSGLSLKGRWSFNADLGMMALSPGHSVKLGKVVGGAQSLDDLLRDMRLAPILQLGVSYSF
ncbi:MAG: hypothetical protein AD742_12060 [Methylibium sp. NZG]|nr:MAG: hypothetical protein AD742_12060 [Methylibium sp. NZG]